MNNNDQYFIIKSSGDGLPTNYSAVNVLQYTADTTYSPSANLLYARVICVGSGGGGGSGGIAGIGATRTGGGAGQSGLIAMNVFYNTELTASTYDIVIGAGGGGGAAVIGAGAANGNEGGNGNDTTFGTISTSTYVLAKGGIRGINGATTANSGRINLFITACIPDSIDFCYQSSRTQNTNSGDGSNGYNGFDINAGSTLDDFGGPGGAGNGAGKTTIERVGGDGGALYDKDGVISAVASGGTAGGGHGQNGLDNIALQIIRQYPISGVTAWNTLGIGTCGAGGGSSNTDGIVAGNGGNGGLYGAAGGGGGAGLVSIGGNDNGSGAGGDGAQGLCIIIEYLK